jgi:hypothetical protein
MRTLLIIFIGILFSSCATNKIVDLSPVEPYEYIENDVIFKISSIQNFWIYFQMPLLNELSKIKFSAVIMTNENIENVYLKSITFNISELDIILISEDIMLPIPNRANSLSEPDYSYWSYFEVETFETTELLNKFNQNISLNKLFQEFNKVRYIEFCTTIAYIINNEYKETILTWRYKTRKRTSLAWWDAWMGI